MKTPINEAISPVTIKAVEGDITAIDTDAMVNSANTAMVLGGSRSVASSINQKTEERLESILSDDDKYPKPVPLGQVCVTEGDVLPCQFVFHLSTHGNLEEMEDAAGKLGNKKELPEMLQRVILNTINIGVENLLRECEERGLKRITIPIIGTGTLNLPKLLAIEVLVGSLTTHLQEKTPKFLREIYIVTLEKSIFGFLTDYLENLEIDVSSNNESDMVPSEFHSSLVSSKIENIKLSEDSQNILENISASPESIAFDAIEEISNLKRKIKQITTEKRNLEKENQKFREKIRNLEHKEGWHREDLPMPLAFAQNILSSEENPNGRLLNTITATGIVSKYFSSLVCAEYQAAGYFNEEINLELRNFFSQHSLTDGLWLRIGRSISRAFKDENRKGMVISEFVKLWLNEDGSWSKFSEVLRDMINLRNKIHDNVNAENARALDWLSQFNLLWEEMCKLSTSLLDYELVFIDSIQDFVPGGGYRYAVKYLKGGRLLPQSGILELDEEYHPNELLLFDRSNGGMLELSPFMVYEYSQVTNSREAYCLDHIQSTRFQFRAFRYAHIHHADHEGVTPFFKEQ